MIPHISDKGRRALRTALQVLAAFLSFAAVYPLLVAAIGAPTGSHVAAWLATAGTWITTAATIITRIMAIPAVDQVLTLLGVGSIARSQVQVSLKQIDAPELDDDVAITATAIDAGEQDAPDPEPVPVITSLDDIATATALPAAQLAVAPAPTYAPAPTTPPSA